MTAAWARLGGRSSPRTVIAFFLEQTTSSFHRPIVLTFDRRTYTSAAAWPISNNEPPPRSSNDEQQPHITLTSLDLKLRRLATLNGGITINPRSPKRVSHLLYNNGEGPTNKAALERIITHDDDHHDEDDRAYDSNRKEIAKLVLQCRELLAAATNYNDDKCENGGVDVQQQKRLLSSPSQLTFTSSSTRKYSNSALLDTMNTPETIIEDDDTNIAQMETKSSFPIIEAAIKNTVSPTMNAYEQLVLNLFPNGTERNNNEEEHYNISLHHATDTDTNLTNYIIHPYWIEPLLSLTKLASRSLVKQLSISTKCPMGYDPTASNLSQQQQQRGSTTTAATLSSTTASPLLSYVRNQKLLYFRDVVILTRVGDFYEAYGIDAIMLVEHCGLNPMALKARAGCPWRNIQDTLDKLTNSGFRVAVYEEDDRERKEGNGKWKRMSEGNDEVELVVDTSDVDGSVGDSGNGSKGNKLKTRYLSQVVSSANPTYMHGLVLSDDYSVGGGGDLSFTGRNYVGVIALNAGYTLVEICAEKRTAVISERLTSEAVCCRLAAFPPADPIFYVPPSMTGSPQRTDRLPFLPWMQKQQTSRSGRMLVGKVQVKTLPSSLVVGPRHGLSDIERAKQTIVSAFLRLEEYDHRVFLIVPSDEETRTQVDDSDTRGLYSRRHAIILTHDYNYPSATFRNCNTAWSNGRSCYALSNIVIVAGFSTSVDTTLSSSVASHPSTS